MYQRPLSTQEIKNILESSKFSDDELGNEPEFDWPPPTFTEVPTEDKGIRND